MNEFIYIDRYIDRYIQVHTYCPKNTSKERVPKSSGWATRLYMFGVVFVFLTQIATVAHSIPSNDTYIHTHIQTTVYTGRGKSSSRHSALLYHIMACIHRKVYTVSACLTKPEAASTYTGFLPSFFFSLTRSMMDGVTNISVLRES